jgi:hypothetical protein
MPSLTLKWVTQGDSNVCPICEALEKGSGWTFELGVDAFPPFLTDPTYGVVYDTQVGSEAHGRHDGSCRCHLAHTFNLKDMVDRSQALLETVKDKYQPTTEAPP